MIGINIPRSEQEALKAVDLEALRQRIRQCIDEEIVCGLRDLHLDACGMPVSTQLGIFERALTNYCQAKMAKKREDTLYSAERAGRSLFDVIGNLKEQAETQQQERELFYVEDRIMPPVRLTSKLSVRISYRWRKTPDDNWTYGSITFIHDVKPRHDFLTPRPARKPSAAREEQDHQDDLYREWEYLASLALNSVSEYFRNGRNGASLPTEVKAKADPYTQQLNNFSTNF